MGVFRLRGVGLDLINALGGRYHMTREIAGREAIGPPGQQDQYQQDQ